MLRLVEEVDHVHQSSDPDRHYACRGAAPARHLPATRMGKEARRPPPPLGAAASRYAGECAITLDMERTIVLYHGSCPDGFGGAYAAWKKFGESAEYIPLHRDAPPATDFAGAHLYFIDFTYPKEIMDQFVAEAASVVVLDHHEGM